MAYLYLFWVMLSLLKHVGKGHHSPFDRLRVTD
ncbi:hypothetical protein ACVW0P_002994 [Mucilaginibacter sp. UYNi724]